MIKDFKIEFNYIENLKQYILYLESLSKYLF